jgi:hypothetical protein
MNFTNIEASATLLLNELEYAIINGANIPANVILQMNQLKIVLEDENIKLAKDLEEMYNRSKLF